MFAAGCKTTLLVHNATVAKMIPLFKDYVGIHGYGITYANDQTGSYNVDLGSVYMPENTIVTKNSMVTVTPPPKDSSLPMTAYEETTWNSVSTPGHIVEATASVSMIQQGSDVAVFLDTNGVAGPSLNDLQSYLQNLGYSVDVK